MEDDRGWGGAEGEEGGEEEGTRIHEVRTCGCARARLPQRRKGNKEKKILRVLSSKGPRTLHDHPPHRTAHPLRPPCGVCVCGQEEEEEDE